MNGSDPSRLCGNSWWQGLGNWYMGGMGGFSNWVDQNLMSGSTENFGTVSGEYDSGQAPGWQVAGAAAWWGGNLVNNAFMLKAAGAAGGRLAANGLAALAEAGGDAAAAGACFTAGTPVTLQTDHGAKTRPIEQVRAGDLVATRVSSAPLSRDVGSRVQRVAHPIVRHASSLVTLSLADARRAGCACRLALARLHALFRQQRVLREDAAQGREAPARVERGYPE